MRASVIDLAPVSAVHNACLSANVPIERSHDADAREHRWPSRFHDQHQTFDCRLPFIEVLVGLRKLGDASASAFEDDESAAIGQHNRVVEWSFPTLRGFIWQHDFGSSAGARRASKPRLSIPASRQRDKSPRLFPSGRPVNRLLGFCRTTAKSHDPKNAATFGHSKDRIRHLLANGVTVFSIRATLQLLHSLSASTALLLWSQMRNIKAKRLRGC